MIVGKAQRTVDEFAQDLCKLYAKAYATVTQYTLEAKEVGQRVLAGQFITGLHAELQSKIVGMKGESSFWGDQH